MPAGTDTSGISDEDLAATSGLSETANDSSSDANATSNETADVE